MDVKQEQPGAFFTSRIRVQSRLHYTVNGREYRLHSSLTLTQAKRLLGSPRKVPEIIDRAICKRKIARRKEYAAVFRRAETRAIADRRAEMQIPARGITRIS